MKHEIIFIGQEDEIRGYRLAGAQTYLPDDPALPQKLIEKECLIFITHKADEKLTPQLRDTLKKQLTQIIPDAEKPYTQIDSLIKNTIGFDLRK